MIDFDAFLAEQRARTAPPTFAQFKVGGKVYLLPRELPAIVALDVLRMKKQLDAKADVPPDSLMTIGEALFGQANFREILIVNQLGIPDLGNLITQAFHAYGELTAPESAELDPPPAPTQTPST